MHIVRCFVQIQKRLVFRNISLKNFKERSWKNLSLGTYSVATGILLAKMTSNGYLAVVEVGRNESKLVIMVWHEPTKRKAKGRKSRDCSAVSGVLLAVCCLHSLVLSNSHEFPLIQKQNKSSPARWNWRTGGTFCHVFSQKTSPRTKGNEDWEKEEESGFEVVTLNTLETGPVD